jgi:DNA-directed RNA polymerase II subunit RPB11
MNQPNRIDSWILEEDQKPYVKTFALANPSLTITEDPKLTNAATITIRKQDHTLGNMIRA